MANKLYIFYLFLLCLVNQSYSQNYSFEFNGSGANYIEVADANELNPYSFTIELWIKRSPEGMANHYITKLGPPPSNVEYNFAENPEGLYAYIGPEFYQTTSHPISNKWTHIAVVFDTQWDSIEIFNNGISAGKFFTSQEIINSNGSLFFGGGITGGTTGLIDQIRFSNNVRYKQNFSVHYSKFENDANTVGLWYFDENANTAEDASGNGNTGTVHGPAWSTDAPPDIIVTSPNGGDFWSVGTKKSIAWKGSNVANVKLEYTTNNGANWMNIISSTPASTPATTPASTGFYKWIVPNTPSTQCKVRVSDVTDSFYYDISNDVFTISNTPAMNYSLLFNNAGDYVEIKDADMLSPQNFTIELWIKQPPLGSWGNSRNMYVVKPSGGETIEYAFGENAQGLYTYVKTDFLQTTSHPISNEWTHIAATFDNQQNKIEIFNDGISEGIINTSQEVPNSDKKLYFGVLPQYPDNRFIGSIDQIRFSNNVRYKQNFSVHYSKFENDANTIGLWYFDEGSGFIAYDSSGNNNYGLIYGIADWSFGVPIIVTSPNGGENWTVGSSRNISWTSTKVENIKIEYTTNNGTNWIEVISSTPTSALSYNWIIPNTPSAQCKVKISDVTDSSYNDLSNNAFSISGSTSIMNEHDKEIPKEYFLSQNYPNPLNPSTTIRYAVPKRSLVRIKISDMLGREVNTLVEEEKSDGYYEVNFDAGNLASGIYFYRMQAGDYVETKKMILLK